MQRTFRRAVAASATAFVLVAVLGACSSSSGSDGDDASGNEAKATSSTTLPPREPGVEFPITNAEAAAEDLAAITLQNFTPNDPSFGAFGEQSGKGSWADAGIKKANLVAAAIPATPDEVSWYLGVVDFKTTTPPFVAMPFAVKDSQGGCAFGVVYVDANAPTAPKSKVVPAPPGGQCTAGEAATLFESGLAG